MYCARLRVVIYGYNFERKEKENKSERWMPRLWEAMKDVVSCDKVRGGANNL